MGSYIKKCPWILSSNEEPFFIALMTPLLSCFGYSYTEFSYSSVYLCTGRLPVGLASQSVTQQEDTYPCSYTGHNASLQLSISIRHCSTGRASARLVFSCGYSHLIRWSAGGGGGAVVKGQDVQNNDALCMSRAPFQTHSSISIHSTFTRSLGWR